MAFEGDSPCLDYGGGCGSRFRTYGLSYVFFIRSSSILSSLLGIVPSGWFRLPLPFCLAWVLVFLLDLPTLPFLAECRLLFGELLVGGGGVYPLCE